MPKVPTASPVHLSSSSRDESPVSVAPAFLHFEPDFSSTSIEAVRFILRRIQPNHLPILKSFFANSRSMRYFERGQTVPETEWEQGGLMYNRFQRWLKRGEDDEMTWWIAFAKGSEQPIGTFGFYQDKQKLTIDVAVVLTPEHTGNRVATEAILFLYWWHHLMDLQKQTYNLDRYTVLFTVHKDNRHCQNLALEFGMQSNGVAKDVKDIDLVTYNKRVHFTLPVIEARKKFESKSKLDSNGVYSKIQQILRKMSPLPSLSESDSLVASFSSPSQISSPSSLASPIPDVIPRTIHQSHDNLNQPHIISMHYADTWLRHTVSINAKKVEWMVVPTETPLDFDFAMRGDSNLYGSQDYLACIDTNQLTSLGTVSIPRAALHERVRALKGCSPSPVAVHVRIYTGNGTLVLQANKSKRKRDQTNKSEKLEYSEVIISDEGSKKGAEPSLTHNVTIQLQAGSVQKESNKRVKCFACIEIVCEGFVIDSIDTVPFYVIAKRNYQVSKLGTKAEQGEEEPSKESSKAKGKKGKAETTAIESETTQQLQLQPQMAQQVAALAMSNHGKPGLAFMYDQYGSTVVPNYTDLRSQDLSFQQLVVDSFGHIISHDQMMIRPQVEWNQPSMFQYRMSMSEAPMLSPHAVEFSFLNLLANGYSNRNSMVSNVIIQGASPLCQNDPSSIMEDDLLQSDVPEHKLL